MVRYLDIQNESTGYLILFNFNKKKKYTREWIKVDGKNIYEVIV